MSLGCLVAVYFSAVGAQCAGLPGLKCLASMSSLGNTKACCHVSFSLNFLEAASGYLNCNLIYSKSKS